VIVQESPPPPMVERRPRQPGPDFVWIEGHWSWARHRGGWVWIAGHWDRRPGYVWIAGHWDHRREGWIWVEGRWGVPAPVVVGPPPPPPAPVVVGPPGPPPQPGVNVVPPPTTPEVVVYSAPPAIIVEERGRPPGPEFAWNGRWVWIHGVWRHHPHWHPGGGWVEGHWEARGGGQIWIEGYWR
jgi:hypothetical protein